VIAGSCPSDDDILVAQLVSRKLGIPFEVIDFSKNYEKRVVDYMFSEYEKGRTPNPDILCNREIKFDVFLEKALEVGADFVATGHYCRKDRIEIDGNVLYRLLEGKDRNKDQSYFLCQLSQIQLEKALFPVGELQKPQVRAIADKLGLASAKKKDSQGICFVGKVDLPIFLQQKLKSIVGDIILIPEDSKIYSEIQRFDSKDESQKFACVSQAFHYKPEDGRIVGKHQGAYFYTIGQRKGLGVGGLKEAGFVLDIDVDRNIVYIGIGKEHPGLYRKGLSIENSALHYVRPDLKLTVGKQMDILCRIRYRQALQKATLNLQSEGAYVIFDELQRSIAPGQFAAFYCGDELIGSGVIS
jgi:tRNA-specific 2-thiouridylase